MSEGAMSADWRKSSGKQLDRRNFQIFFKNKRSEPVIKSKVGEIINATNSVIPRRAGVILYTLKDEVLYFGFGVDAESHELTDFGGGVRYREDRDPITAALREFNEETLYMFEELTIDVIKDCAVIYDRQNLIVFIRIDLDPEEISRKFLNQYQESIEERKLIRRGSVPEVCGITWLPSYHLDDALDHKSEGFHIYERVREFLRRTDDIYSIL